MKKMIVLLVIGFLAFFIMAGCDGLIPAEGEGEGEGEPEPVKATVLVEAYIAEGCVHCAQVEPILEQLAGEYGREEMILVELAPWLPNSQYYIPEAYQRYQWYGLSGGVPQILFNGLNNNSYGESTIYVIKNRIEAQLAVTPSIELQASRTTDSMGTVITGRVKNISSGPLSNLVVNGMVFKDKGATGFHYSVTDIFEDKKVTISSLAPGEEKSFTITISGLNWTGQSLDGVVFVQSVADSKKTIRQSLFLD
jgi:thiol-disulfide isomerase/thioredoxin